MSAHNFDGALQQAQMDNAMTQVIEHALLNIVMGELGINGKAAYEITKAVDDYLLNPQMEGSLNACQAIEAVSQDPDASKQFIEATAGKSQIPQDFDTYNAKQRADCMVALLEQNSVDLNGQEMQDLVDASKQPGARNKLKQICNTMAQNHPVV